MIPALPLAQEVLRLPAVHLDASDSRRRSATDRFAGTRLSAVLQVRRLIGRIADMFAGRCRPIPPHLAEMVVKSAPSC